MPYVPDPKDVTAPIEALMAETAAAEFRVLKGRVNTLDNASVRAADGTTLGHIPDAATRANKVLAFDNDGNLIVALAAAGTATDVLINLASGNLDAGVSLVNGSIRVVNTVADLRTCGKRGQITAIRTLGYYTKGDGGAGYYYYDSTDTVSADNGGLVIVAADSTRWKLLVVGQLNVKCYGAKGDNANDDGAAINAALLSGYNVYAPEGTYLTSQTVNVGQGVELRGAGQYRTTIKYTGAGSGVFVGSSTTALRYNCVVKDLTVLITNRGSNTAGVELRNAVYFTLENISCFGSGSPNDPNPTNYTLYGAGLLVHTNSIIGRITHVSCRLWNKGYYFKTDATSASDWTAAITVNGQGEVANNMTGIMVGDPTIGFESGANVTFRDLCIQGNYFRGVDINAGDNTIIDATYFEGNANYDIVIGDGASSPLSVHVTNCLMNAENIGTTNYGTFPYIQKIWVKKGTFALIDANELSITANIPLIQLEAGADSTIISRNRLNSSAGSLSRIIDNGTNTITRDNFPEPPAYAAGSVTRLMTAASGTQVVTGLGFRPSRIRFFAAVDSGVSYSDGTAGLGNGVTQRCIATDSSNFKLSSSDAVRVIRGAGNEQKASLTAVSGDGFTLTWTKVGAPAAETAVVNFEAWR